MVQLHAARVAVIGAGVAGLVAATDLARLGYEVLLFERSADIADAVAKVIEGKSFDYGTVCSSEQAIVAEEALKEGVLAALKAGKAHFCNALRTYGISSPLRICGGPPGDTFATRACANCSRATRLTAGLPHSPHRQP